VACALARRAGPERSHRHGGLALGLHHETVQRWVERAVAEGPLAVLDDRPRPGREPTITLEAKAWLWCRWRELWTTRLLARHARGRGRRRGMHAWPIWRGVRAASHARTRGIATLLRELLMAASIEKPGPAPL